MEFGDKWLGKVAGGFSIALIGGYSYYQANLWNMNGGEIPIKVIVKGKQLGLVANAEVSHAVIFLTGAPHPDAFDKIESRGIDWSLNFVGGIDNFAKSLGHLVKVLKKIPGNNGNWAQGVAVKKAVQAAMGDFEIPTTKPSFMLIPTPLSGGLGAGVFYEWQTLVKAGNQRAWNYVKPIWWLSKSDGALKLQLANIPEKDNAIIPIHITRKTFGADNVLRFARGNSKGSPVISGRVKHGYLVDDSNYPGIRISDKTIEGITDVGFFSTERTKENFAGQQVEIGVNVATSFSGTNLYKWRSQEYASVGVDSAGAIKTAYDIRTKY